MDGSIVVSEFDEEMASFTQPVVPAFEPLYKVIADDKIAVSKKEGEIWQARLKLAEAKLKERKAEWEKNIDVYLGANRAESDENNKRLKLNEEDKVYENILWSNTNALNRETIMKLPSVELTANSQFTEPYISILKKAVNKYMAQVGNNGVNAKEKLQKCDIGAQLTNRGIIRLDWNDTVNSEDVKAQIKALESELLEAKDADDIRSIEGKLYALNEKLSASGMSGLQLTIIDPRHLYIDPNSQLETGLDADWMIEERTEFVSILRAKYGNGEDGTVYSENHGKIGSDDDDNKYSYVLGGEDDDETKCEELRTTTTYYIWDKVKKRVYLYEKGKWTYPLWVWEDPYNLTQFFPFFILNYNISPNDNMSSPECSYYLPLQNEINSINSMISTARARAFNIVAYNGRADISNKDLQNITNGKKGYVKIDLPPEVDYKSVFLPMITPAMESQTLTNKYDLYAMIQKMSSSDPTSRGEEYRTNTTNVAIQQYAGAKKVIVGIRIDKIISFYCRIAKEVIKLMLERFKPMDWAKFCNDEEIRFITENPATFEELDFEIAGDDTVEPTSAMKKQEAIQLAQVLGQFSAATPAVAIIMLRVISRAFNEVVINKEDWDMIFNSLQQQQQQQQQMMITQGMQQPSPEMLVQQAAMQQGV